MSASVLRDGVYQRFPVLLRVSHSAGAGGPGCGPATALTTASRCWEAQAALGRREILPTCTSSGAIFSMSNKRFPFDTPVVKFNPSMLLDLASTVGEAQVLEGPSPQQDFSVLLS